MRKVYKNSLIEQYCIISSNNRVFKGNIPWRWKYDILPDTFVLKYINCQNIPAEGNRQTVQAKALSLKGDQYL